MSPRNYFRLFTPSPPKFSHHLQRFHHTLPFTPHTSNNNGTRRREKVFEPQRGQKECSKGQLETRNRLQSYRAQETKVDCSEKACEEAFVWLDCADGKEPCGKGWTFGVAGRWEEGEEGAGSGSGSREEMKQATRFSYLQSIEGMSWDLITL